MKKAVIALETDMDKIIGGKIMAYIETPIEKRYGLSYVIPVTFEDDLYEITIRLKTPNWQEKDLRDNLNFIGKM